MVAKIKPRLATNIIFTTVVVSLLTWKYQFTRLQLRHFISATEIRYWSISVFYRAPICWKWFCLCCLKYCSI